MQTTYLRSRTSPCFLHAALNQLPCVTFSLVTHGNCHICIVLTNFSYILLFSLRLCVFFSQYDEMVHAVNTYGDELFAFLRWRCASSFLAALVSLIRLQAYIKHGCVCLRRLCDSRLTRDPRNIVVCPILHS